MTTLAGQTLGKYQLIERLGRGGMADVYKGYQPGLDRYVAVKVLHPHLSEDPGFITRFKREAKSVAELRHPHIVQVFDFDVQAEHYYMVMEHIADGKTLKQLLQDLAAKGERLPIDRTLDIVARLADALAYAHGLNMIHRDIKPANVLLPSLDRPVLSDFGIARLLGETGLTSSGAMIGTPAYMSPEQGRGERGDARSDIYALGIVLYEMLTGRPPYDADTPYAVILKHINDPLLPPRSIVGNLPEPVERIVLKCLAKNPDDRFGSMVDLRDALRTVASGVKDDATPSISAPPTAIRAAPATPTSITGRPAARPSSKLPRWVWIVAAIVVLGGGIGLIAALSGRSQANETAQRTSDAVQAMIDAGYQSLFNGGTDDALDQFNRALALEPDNPHALVAWAVAELARYGDADAAAQKLNQAAPSIPDDPYLHYGYGLLYIRSDPLQDPPRSEAEFTQAIEACGDDKPLCIAVYYERAGVRFWNLDDHAGGLADVDSALALSDNPDMNSFLYGTRADLRQADGDLNGAMEDYQAAYDLSGSADFLERAAATAVIDEDYDQALEYYDRLLGDFPSQPHYLVGRGYVQWRAGDFAAAIATGRRASALDSSAIEAHYLIGLTLIDLGDPQTALDELRVFAEEPDADKMYSAGHPFFTIDFGREIHYDLARALHALGDLDGALNLLDQSLQANDYWPFPYIERGQILAERDDLEGARLSYEKALETAYDNPDLQDYIRELLADLSE